MGWVDPWVRLGCRVGWVGSRFFSFWWVGLDSVHYSKSTGLQKIGKDYVNALKARLDKIWLHQAVKFDFTVDLTTKLQAQLLVLLSMVELGQNFPTCSGLGWVGSVS